jgi:hypothetical protein
LKLILLTKSIGTGGTPAPAGGDELKKLGIKNIAV